jgi:hypothetical protein
MPSVRAARSAAMRRRYGVDCQFLRSDGKGGFTPAGTFRVITKQVATNLTGVGYLAGASTTGPKFANTDSRQFDFSPSDFPSYPRSAPRVGDRLIYAGAWYEVTHVTEVGIGGVPDTFIAYGYKDISPALTPQQQAAAAAGLAAQEQQWPPPPA